MTFNNTSNTELITYYNEYIVVFCECEREPAGGDVYKMVNLLLIWIALPCIATIGMLHILLMHSFV